jgi:hypothetical protein
MAGCARGGERGKGAKTRAGIRVSALADWDGLLKPGKMAAMRVLRQVELLLPNLQLARDRPGAKTSQNTARPARIYIPARRVESPSPAIRRSLSATRNAGMSKD